ncbi:hypothetical protein GCM10009623_07130 [Nocardioides aestuarii]|uniref:Uncharacterized protein n=1 Tax=Nocardioides aestuarii TaxID=252231 RepID=A0ABW4TI67_9ACTN
MTTWADVGLTLAGAPIGALITVGGVWLTNRHNTAVQHNMLDSQERQQRAQLESDLRIDVQRTALSERLTLYVQVLAECDLVESLSAWATGSELPEQGPLTNEEVHPRWLAVRKLRRQVDVHCSSEVRFMMRKFADAVEGVDETAEPEKWELLAEVSTNLRACIVEAAVIDRTSGLAADGLGGA